MSEQVRSEQVCPVCGQHRLALDRPPEIDVMGVQAYSDMLGMGDFHDEGPVGIVCLNCGTHWRDKDAFDRGEADPGRIQRRAASRTSARKTGMKTVAVTAASEGFSGE